MAKRHSSRQAARRRSAAARHPRAAKPFGRSLYYRSLRCEPLEDRRLLAVVTVDTLDDSVDFTDGLLSLREALFATNTVPGPDTIQFAPALTAGGPATIVLTEGELDILDSLTIEGPGDELLTLRAMPTVNQLGGTGIFTIYDPVNPTPHDVTISGLTLTGSTRTGFYGFGGAIANGENLRLDDMTITGNTGSGGIFSGGLLEITNCIISGNSSYYAGGGLLLGVGNGQVTKISNTVFSHNSAMYGGGIRADVYNGGTLEITDCVITNNQAGVEGSEPSTGAGGGGIHLRGSGTATVSSTQITSNIAYDYGQQNFDGGGGVFAQSSGDFKFIDCEISGNTAINRGGGIFGSGSSSASNPGTLSFEACVIANNSAIGTFFNGEGSGSGGGARLSNNVLITRSVFVGNFASRIGGGLYTNSGITIEDSLFDDNSAVRGGGIFVNVQFPRFTMSGSTLTGNSADFGGAILLFNASSSPLVEITQCTISQNSAIVGGAIHSDDEDFVVSHSTIAFNGAAIGGGIFGPITLDHSIVAENSESDLALLTGDTATVRNSLIGSRRDNGLAEAPVGSPDANGNLVGGLSSSSHIDPLLGPLADNGGPTPTHALLPGSPAINAGDPDLELGDDGLPLHDQRGVPFTRVYGGRIDIGAFEAQPTGVLLGDYNVDGAVNGADYTVWRDEMTAGFPLYADGNGDGTVDDADFQLWRSNYGATLDDLPAFSGGSATAVETPALAPQTATDASASFLEVADAMTAVIVDTNLDVVDFTDGLLSLREAIFATNTVPGPDTIRFDPALTASGPATILLEHGELVITDDLSIEGPGAELLTIDASGNDDTPDEIDGKGSQVFGMRGTSLQLRIQVQLSGLKLTGGDNKDYGGAIENIYGDLGLLNCTIVENAALAGGGIYFSGGFLTIIGGAILGNSATSVQQGRGGGGIFTEYGDLLLDGVEVSGNSAARLGGGIAHGSGSITILSSMITCNTAGEPDSLYLHASGGGGIALNPNLHPSHRALLIQDSVITGNSTSTYGGGIYINRSFSTSSSIIERTIISDNTALLEGGGILTLDRQTTILDSVILGNSAGTAGGGILSRNYAQLLTEAGSSTGSENAAAAVITSNPVGLVVHRSAVSNNTAGDVGGGIAAIADALTLTHSTVSGNFAEGEGGGIYFNSFNRPTSHLAVTNSTISNNQSDEEGGGIFVQERLDGISTISHSTITQNHALDAGGGVFLARGTLQIDHTIIASNNLSGFLGATFSPRYSLIGTSAGSGLTPAPVGSPDANGNLIGGTTNQTHIDPQLGFLSDNGGFTLPDGNTILTHRLQSSSPAINAGDPDLALGDDGLPLHDQRGVPYTRVYGGRIDIGAFESQPTGVLLGDYNVDGAVNGADYTVWRDEMTAGFPFYADGNGDGAVDNADFQIWRSNFGATLNDLPALSVAATFASASAPTEPAVNAATANLLEPAEDIVAIVVDTLSDVVDFTDGLLSLREAIFATNTVPGPDTIQFAPALTAGGPATILLEHGELLITDDVTIEGPGAELLTIDASGTDPTPDRVDGAGSRIFNIDDGDEDAMISVNLSGLKLTGVEFGDSGGAVLSREQLWIRDSHIVGNTLLILHPEVFPSGGAGVYSTGSLRLSDSVISNNRIVIGLQRGIGVYSEGAELIVEGCTISENVGDTSARGGGIYSDALVTTISDSTISNNQAGNGGGIYCRSEEFTVTNSFILNNGREFGGGFGGGIYSGAESVLISHSTIADNRSSGLGGGIYTRTAMTIVDSKIADNYADSGGGVAGVFDAEYTIIRSTIQGNNVRENDGRGGGIFIASSFVEHGLTLTDSSVIDNTAGGTGGGIYTEVGATITGSTISGNFSGSHGGGVFVRSGESELVSIAHSTVANNVAGESPNSDGAGGGIYRESGLLSLNHALVVGNHDDGLAPDVAGVFSSDYSLIGIGAEFLGPLADNGGPTPTHALLPGSPAINAGDPNLQLGDEGLPLHDQRGVPFTRVYGGRIDIGAIESQPTGLLLGDYNANGIVDAADYTVWHDEMMTGFPLYADGNGDGTVDNADFQLWRSNFGATLDDLPAPSVGATFASASAPTDVVETPEPATSSQFEPPTSAAIAAELSSGRPIARRADRAMAPRADFARTHFDQADFDRAARQDRLLGAWAAATLPRGDSLETRGEPLFDPVDECEAADRMAQSIDVVFTRLGARHAKALVR